MDRIDFWFCISFSPEFVFVFDLKGVKDVSNFDISKYGRILSVQQTLPFGCLLARAVQTSATHYKLVLKTNRKRGQHLARK